MGAIAIIDASVFYGAQRIMTGVHRDQSWKYRGRFREDDDREFFLQFIHFAVLYDKLLLDNSSLASGESTSFEEDSISRESSLTEFLANMNALFEVDGSALVEQGSFGAGRGGDSKSFELGMNFADLYANVSRLVAEAVVDGARAARLKALDVPWAYKDIHHSNWTDFEKAAQSVGLAPEWIPQAIFAWRGLWYTELASLVSEKEKVSVAYAAAPRRIAVLRELMADEELVTKLTGRNAAIAAIRKYLPELPAAVHFTDIKSLSPYRLSPIGQVAATRDPEVALQAVAEIRRDRADLRDWWETQIFQPEERAAPMVGFDVILSDLNVTGNVTVLVGYPQRKGEGQSMATDPIQRPTTDIRIERAKSGKDISASAEADSAKIGIKDVSAGGSIKATHTIPEQTLWLFHWGRAKGKTAIIGLIIVVALLAIIAAVLQRWYR